MSTGEFKIRTLPRGDEKAAPTVPSPGKAAPVPPSPADTDNDSDAQTPRLIIYAGSFGLLVLAALLWLPGRNTPAPAPREVSSASSNRINDEVNKHLQEAELKREMMIHQSEIENYQFKANADDRPSHPEVWSTPEDRLMGVQLDSEDSAAQVFQDLNESKIVFNDQTPQDRINAHLATRKWVNETEKAERKQFLANFIKSAYDQGYELQINQDLIVTGVKKIKRTDKININQVLDRLAKGQ